VALQRQAALCTVLHGVARRHGGIRRVARRPAPQPAGGAAARLVQNGRAMRLRLLPAVLLAATACDSDPDTTEEGEPLALDGTYVLAGELDLRASNLLPPPLGTAVDLVSELHTDPGGAIWTLADLAGVPAVDRLRDALPGALESRLEGWMGDHMQDALRANPDVAAALALVHDAAYSVLGEIELTSELTAAGGAAQHRLLGVGFDVDGTAAAFTVDGAPLTSAALTYTVAVEDGDSVASLGAHGFGLPVGTLAYQALEAEVVRRTGSDVRTILVRAADCPGMAAAVADQCVAGVCVGHEGDLRELCEAGIDYLADQLAARFAEADVEILAMRDGTAWLRDIDGDGAVEGLDGWWSAELDLGVGPRPTNVTFTGTR
jgi:hypothetical protein